MPSQMQAAWKPKHNPWLIALTVTLATFMEVLDTSIANVALPHIAGSVGASQEEATWVLTSYLVSSAVILPISGWLSDRFGRKRFYMVCVTMFTACSLLCGLAPTLPALILARILQGLGGGGLAPSEQAILADTFPIEKRGQAFALYGMAVVVAPAIGPTLGGWLTDNYNWHWIFFINLPFGLLSLFLSNRMVEDPPEMKERMKRRLPVDFIGLGAVALGVGLLEFTLDKGQEKDWFGSGQIQLTAFLAVVALVFFAIWEWRHPDPVVDLRLLKNRNFGTAVFLQLILGMVLFGSTVLIPQYLQVLLGYTAERAGMVLSRRLRDDDHDGRRRKNARQGRSAPHGHARLHCNSHRPVQSHASGSLHQLRRRHYMANAPGHRAAVHLYPDQHAQLRRSSDR